jgi:hypothetical protein
MSFIILFLRAKLTLCVTGYKVGRRALGQRSANNTRHVTRQTVRSETCFSVSRYYDTLELTLPTCLNLHGNDAQLASCYLGVHITPLVFNGLENHKPLRGRGNVLPNVGLLIPSQFFKLLTAFYVLYLRCGYGLECMAVFV